jgi:hypothetical protein
MKFTDVRTLPMTDDDNTVTDLENMIRWGQLPSSISDRVGADEIDQFNAQEFYVGRFAQFKGNEQLVAVDEEAG